MGGSSSGGPLILPPITRFNYRTLIAYLPGLVMPSFFATSEAAGSIMTIRPLQSSLRFVEPQLGQTGPLLMNLQFLQAFSVK